jgi:hypothetical protein
VAALAIDDEWSRAIALNALALHLREARLEQGLMAALAIHDEMSRAIALSTFLQLDTENPMLIRNTRQVICDYLLKMAGQKRDAVFALCAEKRLFIPPVLTRELLGFAAQHILEICSEWRWA